MLSEIPRKKENVMWHLFSGIVENVEFAANYYREHNSEMSTIICQLFKTYNLEGLGMPYTMKDFQRDFVMDNLDILSPDEVLKRYSPDDVLKRYSPDEVLKRYSPDDVLKRYSPDERLRGLSSEEIKEYLKRIQN